MRTTFRFLSSPREAPAVLDWFSQLPDPPTPYPKPTGTLLHFGSLGSLSYCPDQTVDIRKSPLVTVVLPQVHRGSLWTVGEVHFLPSPLARRFPPLARVSKRFRIWLAQFPSVFSRAKAFESRWDYFLEGSIRNRMADIFALPEGMQALNEGRYFVADDDNEHVVETVVKSLRLRGITLT